MDASFFVLNETRVEAKKPVKANSGTDQGQRSVAARIAAITQTTWSWTHHFCFIWANACFPGCARDNARVTANTRQ
jgi:hypothetical protein